MVERKETWRKKGKKKLTQGLLLLFFSLMLIGTFFHQSIDDALFRVRVETVMPESFVQEREETIVIDGEQVSARAYETFWRLPAEAVRDGSVFVLEEVKTAYGVYYTVSRKYVEIGAQEEGSVLILAGLTGRERVVAASSGELEDGMRVAPGMHLAALTVAHAGQMCYSGIEMGKSNFQSASCCAGDRYASLCQNWSHEAQLH